MGGSVADWLACWSQAQKGQGSNRSHDSVGGSVGRRQTVHTLVHQAAKSVAALLRVSELISVIVSQPVSDKLKPGGRLPLVSARPAVTPETLKRAATDFAAW